MISIILDVMGISGIVMLGCGLYLVSPELMLIVMGVLFLLLSLLSARGTITVRRGKKKASE